MIFTDREWLRYVTFGIVVGTILGATNTAALLIQGFVLPRAVVTATLFGGVIALVVHAIVRTLLDRATEPPEPSEGTDAPTDTDTTDT